MRQGEIWSANLDPTRGSEQAGFRPVLILSGNLLNTYTPLVICLPLSSKIKNYKGNLVLAPSAQNGLKSESEIFTFHIRSLAKERLIEKIGSIEKEQVQLLQRNLKEILTY